jgi:RHS repeat-associated protein
MITTKQYDFINRLKSIASIPSASAPFSFGYEYNNANQRTRVDWADGSYWTYGYDSLGQVISGKKRFSDGVLVPGQQFEYDFDDIGNRTSTKAGGDNGGGSLRTSTYSANLLNQYSNRTIPNAFDVIGLTDAFSTVYINGSSGGVFRKDSYYQNALAVTNTSEPVWQSVTVSNSTEQAVGPGYVLVPETPEMPSHDLDGNLSSDGRWDYTWDAENRLIKLESRSDAPNGSKRRLEFEYDHLGRRIKKIVTNLDTSEVTDEMRFIYNGWNLIAQLNSDLTARRSFTWGLDLSGSLQGAGGVGGLLLVWDHDTGTYHFPAFDGNGNVAALVGAEDGNASAVYEYGPFGETLRITGATGEANPFRFSTKYADNESELVYYGHRYYNSTTGRWLCRDPIGISGGPNLYGFVGNDPVSNTDLLGMRSISVKFNAFIPGRLKGQYGDNWLPEPMPFSPWYFHGDERSFGGGKSRLHAEATLESKEIGANSHNGRSSRVSYPIRVWSDPSERRKLVNGSWQYDAPATAKASGAGAKDDYPCQTVLRFMNVHAAYGYAPNISPTIDFSVDWTFEVVGKNKVKITASGSHNDFPNFEGIADSKLIYTFDTAGTGPGLGNLNSSTSFSSTSITVDAETPPCCQ